MNEQSVTWEQILAWIVLGLFGAGGIGVAVMAAVKRFISGYTDVKIKELEANLEEERQRFQAELEAAKLKRDLELESARAELEANREKRQLEQKQSELTHAYQQSESSVAQQRLAEILQETLAFIQGRITKSLDDNEAMLSRVDSRTEHQDKEQDRLSLLLGKLEHEQRNLRADFRLLLGIVEEVYEHYKGKLGESRND